MPENRIQQLIDAGVAGSPSDFSSGARHVIQSLSDDEFAHLLSIRAKVYLENNEHGTDFDHCVTEAI